jgi:hypothetical protein
MARKKVGKPENELNDKVNVTRVRKLQILS